MQVDREPLLPKKRLAEPAQHYFRWGRLDIEDDEKLSKEEGEAYRSKFRERLSKMRGMYVFSRVTRQKLA